MLYLYSTDITATILTTATITTTATILTMALELDRPMLVLPVGDALQDP